MCLEGIHDHTRKEITKTTYINASYRMLLFKLYKCLLFHKKVQPSTDTSQTHYPRNLPHIYRLRARL